MKAMEVDGYIIVSLTAGEAENIGHRLNCSSFRSFDSYRVQNGVSGLGRNPLAEGFIKELAACGVKVEGNPWPDKDEDEEEGDC